MAMTQWLSREEIEAFTARSDLRGAWLVAVNWAVIVAVFAGVAWWSNLLTWLLGALLLGGRQLGLAILMHEAGHGTLFRTPRLNALVGTWLCAYPILSDMVAYAASHRAHHTLAGTPDDPDLPNYAAYPVTAASFRRKLLRDVSGQTGLRNLRALFGREGGDIMLRGGDARPPVTRGLVVNAVLLAVLALGGVAELYLVWLLGYVVFYPLLARLRQIAEHAAVPDRLDADPRRNTRTTRAGMLERLLVAPNHVNYHGEHHFMAGVPAYRLPALHRRLLELGYYRDHPDAVAPGYISVMKRALGAV